MFLGHVNNEVTIANASALVEYEKLLVFPLNSAMVIDCVIRTIQPKPMDAASVYICSSVSLFLKDNFDVCELLMKYIGSCEELFNLAIWWTW